MDVQDGLVYLWLGPCSLSTFAVPYTFATQLNAIAKASSPSRPEPSPLVLQYLLLPTILLGMECVLPCSEVFLCMGRYLRNLNQTAVANLDDGCDIDNTRHHPEEPALFCLRNMYYLTPGNASALDFSIRAHNLGDAEITTDVRLRVGNATATPVGKPTAVTIAARSTADVRWAGLDLSAALSGSVEGWTSVFVEATDHDSNDAFAAIDFAAWRL